MGNSDFGREASLSNEENRKEIRTPITWDQYFMKIAEISAERSKDPKTQVGACIVDPKTKFISSIGYNGLPSGFDDKEFNWDEVDGFDKNPYVVHAEANAILQTKNNLEGGILYVTMFPCPECSKLISQKKLSKVIYRDEKFKNKPLGKVAEEILAKAGIETVKFSEDLKTFEGGKNENKKEEG